MRKIKYLYVLLGIAVVGFLYHTHMSPEAVPRTILFAFLIVGFVVSLIFQNRRILNYHKSLKEIESLQQKLSDIINSIPSLLICVDQDFHITLCNSLAHRECPHSTHVAIGKPLLSFFPQLKDELDHIRSCIEGGDPVFLKRKSLKVNGVTTLRDITIFPLAANSAVITITDQTELYRMEELMIQGEKMVSVGKLASGMAHEINNPLAAIIQSAEVIYDRLSNENIPANIKAAQNRGLTFKQLSEYMEERGVFFLLEGLRESGQRVSEIVSSMLCFVRREGTHMSTHRLSDIVEKSIALTKLAYEGDKAMVFPKISIDVEDESTLICNEEEIEQVVFNLLKNSSEALRKAEIPDHDKIVEIRLTKDHQMAILEVEDNGVGISDEIKTRIFDPFFTTKPIGEGMGLGLSVSYFIITETHKGSISCLSSPLKKTIFTVKIPLDREGVDLIVKGEKKGES